VLATIAIPRRRQHRGFRRGRLADGTPIVAGTVTTQVLAPIPDALTPFTSRLHHLHACNYFQLKLL
jgi:hypothetical protein